MVLPPSAVRDPSKALPPQRVRSWRPRVPRVVSLATSPSQLLLAPQGGTLTLQGELAPAQHVQVQLGLHGRLLKAYLVLVQEAHLVPELLRDPLLWTRSASADLLLMLYMLYVRWFRRYLSRLISITIMAAPFNSIFGSMIYNNCVFALALCI